MGLIGVISKLTGGTDNVRPWYAGDFFCPRRGIRFHFVIAGGGVNIAQTPVETVVSHGQIVNGGDQRGAAIRQLQAFYRQLVQKDILQLYAVEVFGSFVAKVRETHLGDIIVTAEQAQAQLGVCPAGAVALLKVPLPFFAPAETDRAVRGNQLAAIIAGHGFPLGIVLLTEGVHQIGGTQHAACRIVAVALFEHHQHRHIGIATHVVGKVLARLVEMELTQHDVTHCHGHCGVGALLRRQPQVAQLGDLGIVRGNGNGFSAFIADFGKEVGVRGTGLRNVRAPGDNVAGVVPVGGFRHVGLLTPGLRGGWREVTVPIVEAQAGAANQ